jgi:citrate lyase beta subunit
MIERFHIETQPRHPVHVFYGGAHLFSQGIFRKLGDRALSLLRQHRPYGDSPLHERLERKLANEPIEDYRIDFEDGYGARSNPDEDADASRVGREFARMARAKELPFRIGIRLKPNCGRARHTLELFIREVVEGPVPALIVVNQPKISSPEEVKRWREMLEKVEFRYRLPGGTLGHELMIEHPAAVRQLSEMVRVAENRLHAGHFGAYDYLSFLGVPFAAQSLDHPYATLARWEVLQVFSILQKPVSDGAVTQLPVGQDRAALQKAWDLHEAQVTRALGQGYFCGWDLHPGQLISRYAALYRFFDAHVAEAQSRLEAFRQAGAQARVSGIQFDDAATAEGLALFLRRGLSCGAIDLNLSNLNGVS